MPAMGSLPPSARIRAMAEGKDAEGGAGQNPPVVSEDDRRAKAAETNRKRTEELWERNKRRWLKANFPSSEEKKKGSPSK
jgi:hypothetical protein